jgi:hypothetical protein
VVVRKGVVRVTARFRKEVHRRLAQEAKAHGVSINDEIERRIESSFAAEDWQVERLNMQAERLNLLTALQLVLVNNPQTSEMREDWKKKRVVSSKLKKLLEEAEEADERDFQRHDLPEALGNEKPRT